MKQIRIAAPFRALVVGLSILTLPAAGADLVVAAAASLTDLLAAVKPRYEQVHPNTKLVFVLGATGQLRAQITRGAPCDVFLAADRWFGGNASNLTEVVRPESVQTIAANTLVLISTRPDTPGSSLTNWIANATRIGIGIPQSVPAGRYAQLVLEENRLWQTAQPKMVFANHVREVLMWIRQDVVDLGFVYASDIVKRPDTWKILATYDQPGGQPIELSGGITPNTKIPETAGDFLAFLARPEIRQLFVAQGFIAPIDRTGDRQVAP